MQTIETRYIGPTDTKGSCIKATASGGTSATIPYPHELSSDNGHMKAAKAVMAKLAWKGRIYGGHTKLAWSG